ncbi:unnamed protein product [Owenia fusiformis]|uniref:Sulfotransferase n=1 Tax=Owenia fusiformis TaxID=6347 RepID=A0A8S4Q7A4_OWEFU|nr:unnamed protein product [Owenia fusiformis]
MITRKKSIQAVYVTALICLIGHYIHYQDKITRQTVDLHLANFTGNTPRAVNDRNNGQNILQCSIYEPLNQQAYAKMIFPRKLTIEEKWIDLEAEVYRQLQLCNLDKLPKELDIMKCPLLIRSNSPFIHMEGYTDCMRGNTTNPFGIRKIDYCIESVLALCKSRSVVLAKVVRGSMEGLSRYLHTINYTNNVKVLHLLRDPRGEINSRVNTVWTEFSNFTKNKQYQTISDICKRIQKDITIRHELEKKYPDIFMQVLYEDLAENANKTMGSILKFIDLPYFPYVQKMLILKSINSSGLAYNWKGMLDKKLMEEIDKRCSEVYMELGYSKTVTGQNYSSKTTKNHQSRNR